MFAGAVSWFPQEQAHLFYMVKGTLALVAVVMLIVHMTHTWHTVVRLGQRLRYLTLLAFAVLAASSTLEQLEQGALVNYRNLATMLCVLLLILAMTASLNDDVRHKRQ